VNIVHVVENLNMGGAERVVIDLALQQLAMGDSVTVVCLFDAGLLAPEVEQQGIRVLACDKQPGFDRAALARLRAVLRDAGPCVVHSHNAMPHYYAVMASLAMPVIRINTRHGMGDFLGTARQRLLYRAAMLFTHLPCCVCDAARAQFVGAGLMPATRAVTVYNGIDVHRFSAPGQGGLRSALALPDDAVVLGTVGRLNAAKDQVTLIRAFALLAKTHDKLHLVIVGDGPERDRLQQCAGDSGYAARIHFPGARHDVQALLPDMAVFALSSLTEGFSVALLEAGAAARPVVATAVGGNGEIIADGERGALVPAADAPALADAIAGLLSAPGTRAQLGEQLRDWVAGHCSKDTMARRYRAEYLRAGAGA
jgi:glycosyltransferase involved in cell wall biosynthesis